MRKCTRHHDFKERLASCAIKPTKHRCRILEFLHQHEGVTADEVAAHVGSDMNRVTVYRILTHLHAHGLLALDHGVNGVMRFSLLDHHTHTITCTSCNKTETVGSSLDSCLFSSVEEKAQKASKLFDAITSHSVHLFGTCTRCAHA